MEFVSIFPQQPVLSSLSLLPLSLLPLSLLSLSLALFCPFSESHENERKVKGSFEHGNQRDEGKRTS